MIDYKTASKDQLKEEMKRLAATVSDQGEIVNVL